MDILRPTLIRIGGRVYRKNLVHEQVHQQEEEDEDFYAGRGLLVASGHSLGVPSDISLCPRTCLCGGVRC